MRLCRTLLLLFSAHCLVNVEPDDEHNQHVKADSDGAAYEYAQTPAGLDQRLQDRFFHLCSQNKADQRRRHRQVDSLEQIPEHPGDQHHQHVVHAVVNRVAAGEADDHNDGKQDLLGHIEHAGEQADAQLAQCKHEERADKKHNEYTGDQIALLGKHQRPRCDTLQHQCTVHNRGDGVARDTQREQRDERRARHGVVGCLGRQYSLYGAVSEFFGVLGAAFSLAVGNEGGGSPLRCRAARR